MTKAVMITTTKNTDLVFYLRGAGPRPIVLYGRAEVDAIKYLAVKLNGSDKITEIDKSQIIKVEVWDGVQLGPEEGDEAPF